MAYIGVLTRSATCAICKNSIDVGEHVYHDATKSQGSHLAHKDCWDTLRKSRPSTFEKKRNSQREIKSTEPLDPPF